MIHGHCKALEGEELRQQNQSSKNKQTSAFNVHLSDLSDRTDGWMVGVLRH